MFKLPNILYVCDNTFHKTVNSLSFHQKCLTPADKHEIGYFSIRFENWKSCFSSCLCLCFDRITFFFKVFWCPQALVEIKDRSHVVVMCLCSVLSCDLCSVGWLIEALMESVWKRNHKCRAVSFRSDVPPPKLMVWKFTPNVGSHQSELACAQQKDPLWSLWTLLRSPRRFEPDVAGANETHYTIFTSSERERRLKFYLINWVEEEEGGGGGFTQYWACGGKHERCERLVCVFFYAPWSQIGKKLLGPQEDSGAALEFTDCVFTKGKRACFRHDPVPSLLEGNGVFWLFTVGCVAKIKKSWKATGSCLQCFVVKCVFILIPKLSHVISLSPTLQNLNRLYWYVNTYKELEWLQFLSLLSKFQEQ